MGLCKFAVVAVAAVVAFFQLKVIVADVEFSLLPDAETTGAVCLDGSPPAYHFDKGSDSGISNWIVHLEGGGWCESNVACAYRSSSPLGSSLFMGKSYAFPGILSSSSTINPYFYNWNRVLLRYCDGASFSGNVEAATLVDVPGESEPRKIYFRGLRIWKAIIEHLVTLGMSSAHKAILAGNSAGGLAALIHCNSFKELLPGGTDVKCLSDAGFFINVKDISGQNTIENFYANVVDTQNVSDALPSGCLKENTPNQCFFASHLLPHIVPPFFILNAAYDTWQWNNVLVPPSSDPQGDWALCKKSLQACSEDQIMILQEFRRQMLSYLAPSSSPCKSTIFLLSCFYHNIAFNTDIWNTKLSIIENKTASDAVGEWSYASNTESKIDGEYPCNGNCENLLM
ncbi:hypothetical protein KP509_35G026400 [Ceratopteris richardii]|uniref:Pectin acetylesterase n=1 Tax=Ceratopteris richardii TaxID=49495 RepID=A0A8T2QGS1_CERRI|nr:hypothetical protein KP509_35G026400 [Ceratopteris richardii]